MMLFHEFLLRPQGRFLLQGLTTGFDNAVLQNSGDAISQWYTLPHFTDRGAVAVVSYDTLLDRERAY